MYATSMRLLMRSKNLGKSVLLQKVSVLIKPQPVHSGLGLALQLLKLLVQLLDAPYDLLGDDPASGILLSQLRYSPAQPGDRFA